MIKIYKCDSCGTTRGIDNHWFVLYLKTKKEGIEDSFGSIIIYPFLPDADGVIPAEGAFHICSAECIAKMVIQFHGKI